jgi:hypothetical protein
MMMICAGRLKCLSGHPTDAFISLLYRHNPQAAGEGLKSQE